MTKRSRERNAAMDAMRRPDARLIQTFSYYGKPDYWIAPVGVRVEQEIAEWIIAHPRMAAWLRKPSSRELGERMRLTSLTT